VTSIEIKKKTQNFTFKRNEEILKRNEKTEVTKKRTSKQLWKDEQKTVEVTSI